MRWVVSSGALALACLVACEETASRERPLLPEPQQVSGVAGAVTAVGGETRAANGATCRGYRFPVPERDGGPVHEMFAEVCSRAALTASTPVQVLIHGGTYDHRYWDWTIEPERYSYVSRATAEGYVTVNVDRLGYGSSDRPNGETLDFDVGARAIEELVRYLRGGVFGARFSSIVLNGHSMGGIVAERVAAKYGSVNGVIVSGLANEDGGRGAPDDEEEGAEDEGGEGGPAGALYPFHPAKEDPKFNAAPWAGSYYTTLPNTRATVFLHEGSYDPRMLAEEESVKDTLSIAELRSVRPAEGTPPQAQPVITVPIVYALGRYDAIACRRSGDCRADVADPSQYILVENSGHSINVCFGASAFYDATFVWLRERGLAPAR